MRNILVIRLWQFIGGVEAAEVAFAPLPLPEEPVESIAIVTIVNVHDFPFDHHTQ
jgi:hypothetical protein